MQTVIAGLQGLFSPGDVTSNGIGTFGVAFGLQLWESGTPIAQYTTVDSVATLGLPGPGSVAVLMAGLAGLAGAPRVRRS